MPGREIWQVGIVSLRYGHSRASNGCRGLEKGQGMQSSGVVSGGFH